MLMCTVARVAGSRSATPADFMPADLRPPKPRAASVTAAKLADVFCAKTKPRGVIKTPRKE